MQSRIVQVEYILHKNILFSFFIYLGNSFKQFVCEFYYINNCIELVIITSYYISFNQIYLHYYFYNMIQSDLYDKVYKRYNILIKLSLKI